MTNCLVNIIVLLLVERACAENIDALRITTPISSEENLRGTVRRNRRKKCKRFSDDGDGNFIIIDMCVPSAKPSAASSVSPTNIPVRKPSTTPSTYPLEQFSSIPSWYPSPAPTFSPSDFPSNLPTSNPSRKASSNPTSLPSGIPTMTHSNVPSVSPSQSPTNVHSDLPSMNPTHQPTVAQSSGPSVSPSQEASVHPSLAPSDIPTSTHSKVPSVSPTQFPTNVHSSNPSLSSNPTQKPSVVSSPEPSVSPSKQASDYPSPDPSGLPSILPTQSPTNVNSDQPSISISNIPTLNPTGIHSFIPSLSMKPTQTPSVASSSEPSNPSDTPSSKVSVGPSQEVSTSSSSMPSGISTLTSSSVPSVAPTHLPSNVRTATPSSSKTPTLKQPTKNIFLHPTTSSPSPSVIPSVSPMLVPTTERLSLSPTNILSNPTSSSSIPLISPSPIPSQVFSLNPTANGTPQSKMTPVQSSLRPSLTPTGTPSVVNTISPNPLTTVMPSNITTSVPTSINKVTLSPFRLDLEFSEETPPPIDTNKLVSATEVYLSDIIQESQKGYDFERLHLFISDDTRRELQSTSKVFFVFEGIAYFKNTLPSFEVLDYQRHLAFHGENKDEFMDVVRRDLKLSSLTGVSSMTVKSWEDVVLSAADIQKSRVTGSKSKTVIYIAAFTCTTFLFSFLFVHSLRRYQSQKLVGASAPTIRLSESEDSLSLFELSSSKIAGMCGSGEVGAGRVIKKMNPSYPGSNFVKNRRQLDPSARRVSFIGEIHPEADPSRKRPKVTRLRKKKTLSEDDQGQTSRDSDYTQIFSLFRPWDLSGGGSIPKRLSKSEEELTKMTCMTKNMRKRKTVIGAGKVGRFNIFEVWTDLPSVPFSLERKYTCVVELGAVFRRCDPFQIPLSIDYLSRIKDKPPFELAQERIQFLHRKCPSLNFSTKSAIDSIMNMSVAVPILSHFGTPPISPPRLLFTPESQIMSCAQSSTPESQMMSCAQSSALVSFNSASFSISEPQIMGCAQASAPLSLSVSSDERELVARSYQNCYSPNMPSIGRGKLWFDHYDSE